MLMVTLASSSQLLNAQKVTLGDRHSHTLGSIGNLVDLQHEAGKLAQATLGHTAATAAEVLGEQHLFTTVTVAKTARLRHAQDSGAVEGKAILGAKHPQTLKYAAAKEPCLEVKRTFG